MEEEEYVYANNIYKKIKQIQMKRVYVVGGDIGYANWLPNITLVDSIEEADVVMFTGGEDVSPSFYNSPKHPTTFTNPRRDLEEQAIFKEAVNKGLYIIGICRGSQFCCVMSGGQLVQNQMNPHYIHNIVVTEDSGNTLINIPITSTHHQAMFPFNLHYEDYEIMAYTQDISKYHKDGNNEEMNPEVEVEICYFKDTKALGIQGHPEMMWNDRVHYQKTFTYLQSLYNDLITDAQTEKALNLYMGEEEVEEEVYAED